MHGWKSGTDRENLPRSEMIDSETEVSRQKRCLTSCSTVRVHKKVL